MSDNHKDAETRGSLSPISPPSRRGARAELLMQRYLKKSARPGRSDALPFRNALMFWSDLPGCALFKVARHLFVGRSHPSSKEGNKAFTYISFLSRGTFLRGSLAALFLCGFFLPVYAQTNKPATVWDGIFTSEQAKRGKAEFDQTCSRCHNLLLVGSERGPAIKGPAFLSHWENGTVADLFIKIRDTMPEGGPGTLREDTKIDILSYILQQNGFPAGAVELKNDVASLEDFRMAKKGIWDGVFTALQAERGHAALQQNGCYGCHGAGLEGARGPSLKGERFMKAWENGSLDQLFTKIRDTMPPLNTEQVPVNVKIDIIAYLLQVNGFPSGSAELPLDIAALSDFQILKNGAAGAANFALVQVLGCLTQDPAGRWILANSTEPLLTKEETASAADLKMSETRQLGSDTFQLVSVTPSFKAESHKGHKMEARGLLYRERSYAELNLVSLAMLASACGP